MHAFTQNGPRPAHHSRERQMRGILAACAAAVLLTGAAAQDKKDPKKDDKKPGNG